MNFVIIDLKAILIKCLCNIIIIYNIKVLNLCWTKHKFKSLIFVNANNIQPKAGFTIMVGHPTFSDIYLQ